MHAFRFFLLFATAVTGFGQGTKADYERARALPQLTGNAIFRDRVTPHWLPDGVSFWYRVATAPGQSEHVLVDALTGQRTSGLAATELARLLSLRLAARRTWKIRLGGDFPKFFRRREAQL